MGAGASKKKRKKQKKKPVADPEKENCHRSPHDDEEKKCSIACAAPLENKQPQNQNFTGQMEQQNTDMEERPSGINNSENNTEVSPQPGMHHFTSKANGNIMGGGTSKKESPKQKTPVADPANDEPVSPCDSAKPDVNAPQEKENCQGSSHDDEETKCSIACAAPLENKQPQNQNFTGQMEQQNTDMEERPSDINNSENNTEVSPQPGMHHFTSKANGNIMGGGTSKKESPKQKKTPVADSANYEPVSPCDSAKPDVNAPQEKENCQGSPRDDEETKCSIACAAPLENKQPQIPNFTGQMEQQNTDMEERPSDINNSENNTEVSPQRSVYLCTRHNTGTAPKARRWDRPNYLSEAPWITTAKVAAFVALRKIKDTEKQLED